MIRAAKEIFIFKHSDEVLMKNTVFRAGRHIHSVSDTASLDDNILTIISYSHFFCKPDTTDYNTRSRRMGKSPYLNAFLSELKQIGLAYTVLERRPIRVAPVADYRK